MEYNSGGVRQQHMGDDGLQDEGERMEYNGGGVMRQHLEDNDGVERKHME